MIYLIDLLRTIFLFLYVLSFIYFLNYFDCDTLEGLDTYIFFCNLWNICFGQNIITESIWDVAHLQYEIMRFM